MFISKFIYFLTQLIEIRGDLFSEMVYIRNHVLQSTYKLMSERRIIQISIEAFKKYIKSNEMSKILYYFR